MVVISTLLLAGLATAAPFSLPNGFPNPSSSALMQIQSQAGGTLPNTALPTSLKADAIKSLQVIAVNEIFETAFFSSLLNNVTEGKSGYTDFDGLDKDYVVKSLTAIRAVSILFVPSTLSHSNFYFFFPFDDSSKKSYTPLVPMPSCQALVLKQLVLATTSSPSLISPVQLP